MKKHTTAERLTQIMNERNMRQVDILDAAKPFCIRYNTKLTKNALSQYISGKVAPGQEKLTILGLALNVSEAWLLGFDVPMERNVIMDDLSDEGLSEIAAIFEGLSPDNRAKLTELARLYLNDQNKSGGRK